MCVLYICVYIYNIHIDLGNYWFCSNLYIHTRDDKCASLDCLVCTVIIFNLLHKHVYNASVFINYILNVLFLSVFVSLYMCLSTYLNLFRITSYFIHLVNCTFLNCMHQYTIYKF